MADSGSYTITEHFRRPMTLDGTTPRGKFGWVVTTTGTSPVHAVTNGGFMQLQFSATSEPASIQMDANNIKCFDIDDIQKFIITCDVRNVDAVSTLVWGLASNRNADEDLITESIWHKIEGSDSVSNVVAEYDDATNTADDLSTGKTLAAVPKKFELDFTTSKNDVRFNIDGTRVADSQMIDMRNYSGELQPYIKIEKASGTAQVEMRIYKVEMQINFGYG